MKMKHHIHGTPGKMTGGTTLVDDRPRADAFWPAWMFALGLFFALFGVILGTVSIVLQFPIFLILGAVVLALIGVAALMCWKNQTIHLQPNDTFVHSTFLGRKKLTDLVKSKV